MIRALLRIVLVLIVLAAAAAFFFGYRIADRMRGTAADPVVGTSGESVNVGRARDAGARVGGAVAEGANEAQRVAADAALTAKIKSKMLLDDKIDAAAINVDTSHRVVRLAGVVGSPEERERAVQLARETEGVEQVVDQLAIR